MIIDPLLYVGPTALAMSACVGFLQKGPRPRWAPLLTEAAAALALMSALICTLWLALFGNKGLERESLFITPRLDALSATMTLLVAFVGWIVARFARIYLDGEPRQGAFSGWLCLTLATVLMLVTSGSLVQLVLAWIATSLFLHKLLLFYPDRPGAQRAARKKFVTARLGDGALIAAAALLITAYGSPNLDVILRAARAGQGGSLAIVAAALLALVAVLKSAQFPTHGWLTEVMETPTPVSALLHAGIVNAGGFLLIRFADVMLLGPGVLAALVILGGFTALFGSVVMLTQPAVKNSLAWSTVAQMGFMTFECGLALFPLALLHIVAHSLYKAHSFLASGGAVERIVAIRRPGPVAVPRASAVIRAFAMALTIYALVGLGFGLSHKSPQAIVLGAILIFGVAYMLAQGFADAAPRALMLRTTLYAILTSISYFALQTGVTSLTAGLLPPPPPADALEWTLLILSIFSFGFVAVMQALLPLWANHPAVASLRVHLMNGLYVNALFDRLIGGWTLRMSTFASSSKDH